MGCNYYFIRNKCGECGRTDEPIHIGKSSVGWPFIFNPKFSSWKTWQREILCDTGFIQDEYGKPVEKKEFCEFVESKQTDRKGFEKYKKEEPRYWDKYEREDDEGYRISIRDFS